MLYTVVPLDRIYSCRTESLIKSSRQNESAKAEEKGVEYKDINLKHGRVHARREGENYVVDGINSTDMSDYLNKEYMPGSVVNADK